jgi:predicted ATP-binding protein involved in virulence
MLRTILARDFAPFGKLDVDFRPIEGKRPDLGEVHLFTGVNGTGKTRLLALIAAILGNPAPLAKRCKGITTPFQVAVTDEFPTERPPDGPFAQSANLARLPYLWVTVSASFQSLHNNSNGKAISIWAASVPAFAYYGSPYVGDVEIKTLVAVPRPNRIACLSFDHGPEIQPLLQAITNLKLQAAMESLNATSTNNSTRAIKLVATLEAALSQITGTSFKFGVETNPAVLLCVIWGDTKLPLDALPDGLRSIIGWMVHALVMMDLCLEGKGDPTETEAVFLLDEIESNLHPAWQRRVLPAFQHLFPKAQIFVATHSPFVISSLNHGWIYRFMLAADGKAKIDRPIAAGKGESYISVVEDIMGMKEWFDVETEKLLSEFRLQREKAYGGDEDSAKVARDLAARIGAGSMELDFMMGRELIQMDRQLAKSAAQK